MNHFRTALICLAGLLIAGLPQKAGSQELVNSPGLLFAENKGQWPVQVDFMAELRQGRWFAEQGAFTFVLYHPEDLGHHHCNKACLSEGPDHALTENKRNIRIHAFRQHFEGSNRQAVVQRSEAKPFHYNYFLGDDPSGWASDVSLHEAVYYREIYSGIDLKASSEGIYPKYEFIVQPGAETSQILSRYEGADSLWINGDELMIATSVGLVREQKPYAYQEIEGRMVEVECRFVLRNGLVGFEFPQSFDPTHILVIDPTLVAASYSGSTATTYGHSATYGPNGHIFSGGRCFSSGYPVTLGAYQTSFGGSVDIAISKLSPNGTALLWATYLGGSADDYVHSMIVDPLDRLFIYGSSASSNYPTVSGCYDVSQNGSYDIIISKLSANGNQLLGSTFVGGSNSDAQNIIPKNYGDTYRGEIVLDSQNNPCVASFTSSSNFPATSSVFDNTYNGGQDGVIFSLDSNLVQLRWSTFIGGVGNDAAMSLKLDNYDNIVVAGGTSSSNFPISPSAQTPVYQGQIDGFVSFLLVNAVVVINSSFFGTASFDQIYFVDLDSNNNVYVYGISDGTIPIMPSTGIYNNPGGHLFVAKFNSYLTSTLFSTRLGGSGVSSSFSPTAFLVDICENIYMAGWGNTTGYPVTAGALMTNTDGSDFYLMVLDKNAISLNYATYFGDNTSTWDHVDGGTSRFDKNGVVYHGVCAGGQGIPTTPGAYGSNNLASWDIAVFKIDFEMISPEAIAVASPSDTLCVNDVFNFVNSSTNFTSVNWNFGDGSPPSTLTSPVHQYSSPGIYQVRLIVFDSTKCISSDTTFLQVHVMPIPVVLLGPDTSLCQGDTLILDTGPGHLTKIWSTGDSTQSIEVVATGTYYVMVSNGPCFSSDTISVLFNSLPQVNLGNDTAVCEGDGVLLDAGLPGSNYLWSTGSLSQTIYCDSSGSYWVDLTDINGCKGSDTLSLTVKPLPHPDLGPDTVLCEGESIILDPQVPAATCLWNNGATGSTLPVNLPGLYYVDVDLNGCPGNDSIQIGLIPDFNLGPDKSLCDYGEIMLDAGTGDFWIWSDGQSGQSITVNTAGTYWVIKQVQHCTFSDSIIISGEVKTTLYFPNTFTPNGDGLNDVFAGLGKGLNTYTLSIFDRNGRLIFYSTDMSNGWNGRLSGEDAPEGVYVWTASMTTRCDPDIPVRLQGTIHLLR
jgi:gliding motility-associated-like protein